MKLTRIKVKLSLLKRLWKQLSEEIRQSEWYYLQAEGGNQKVERWAQKGWERGSKEGSKSTKQEGWQCQQCSLGDLKSSEQCWPRWL